MTHVHTSSSVNVKVTGDEAELRASYTCGHTADLYLEVDGQTAHIGMNASQLDELIAGLRKVRGAMAGDD